MLVKAIGIKYRGTEGFSEYIWSVSKFNPAITAVNLG